QCHRDHRCQDEERESTNLRIHPLPPIESDHLAREATVCPFQELCNERNWIRTRCRVWGTAPSARAVRHWLAGDERVGERGLRRVVDGWWAGDPDGDVHATWVAKEMVRDIYLVEDRTEAHTLLALACWDCGQS